MTPASTSFLRVGLISLLVWGVLGALVAAQLVVGGGFDWADAAALAARDWIPWAILSPFLFTAAARWPLERTAWLRRLPIHLVGAVLVGILVETLARGLGPDPGERFREQRRRWMETQPGQPPGPMPPGRPPGPGGPWRRGGGGPPPGAGRGILSGRIQWNLAVYGVVVSIAHAALFQRRSQERERRGLELAAGLAEARVRALRMQLQPHFLFNTLNAISTLVHQDADRADEMLGNLSEFLRMTLEQGDRPTQPLARELEFVDRYLAIEQVRFGDRLRVEREVDPDTFSAEVPTLILQPLVENAVRHGLEPRSGPGRIRITARRAAGSVELEVADDGTGVPSGGPTREGVGLGNTRARLSEMYGDGARMEVGPDHPRGTRVRLRLPDGKATA